MRRLHLQRYLITGLLTFIPLWLTWTVFAFIFSFLSHVGAPVVAGLFAGLSAVFPNAQNWLNQVWFQSIIAFVRLGAPGAFVVILDGAFAFGKLEIAVHHHAHQSIEADLGLPV